MTKLKELANGNTLFNRNFTDSLRGIAILLVITSHIAGAIGTNLCTPLGGIGVALFLFLSGYGLNESYKAHGLKLFWIKRITKVLLPYFIIETIAAYFKQDFNITTYILDITGIKTAYWYIAFLFKQYIIFYLLTRCLYKQRIFLYLISCILILFLFPNIEAEQAFSFFTGIIVSVHIKKVRIIPSSSVLCIIFAFCLLGISFLTIKQLPVIRMHENDFIYNLIQCGIKMPLAITIIGILHFFPQLSNNKFFLLTGIISYELYLVHMPFYNYAKQWSNALIVIIVSYIISYLFYQVNRWNTNLLKKYRLIE